MKITLLVLLLLILGGIGAIFIAWLTPFGVGIYVDSLSYISSARNLISGVGLGRVTGLGALKPMTHYPPLYSYILALFSLLHIQELITARWISILAFGSSILLVGFLVYHRTRSWFLSLFSAILILFSNPILRNFGWAMTEPLYIVLMLACFLSISIYLNNSLRYILILTAVLTSLALLTRYVGFSLVAACVLVLALNRRFTWRRRLQDVAIFLSITLLPTLVWMVRNWLISETLANRMIKWHPISAENISFLIKSVNSWGLLPQRLVISNETVALSGLLIFLGLIGLVWFFLAIPKPGKSPNLDFVLLCAGWMYIALLTTSLFFIDSTTRLENRILLPLYVMILLLIIIGTSILWQQRTIFSRICVVIICLWMAYFSFTRVDGAIIDLRSDGQGYAKLKWQNSPTALFMRDQDTSIIYTNDVTALYFISGKDSVAIPNSLANESNFQQMFDALDTPDSFLVIFGTLTGEFPPLQKLTRGLTLVDKFEDGMIYQLR